MKAMPESLTKDQFAIKTVGIELIEAEPGKGRAKLRLEEKHLNGLGIVQGGAIFTLADFALAAASNFDSPAVSIQANISYFKAVSSGTLYATAIEESRTTRLGTYLIRITNESDELLALMQATVYRK